MKFKHNKKRNTIFLFETLIRELTKSIVSKDHQRKKVVILMLKEYFSPQSVLGRELRIYKSIVESKKVDINMAQKIIVEAKRQHGQLDKDKIFEEQSNLIKKMNKNLTKEAFSNFVPNYRNMANVHQIFNLDLAPNKKVLLEQKVEEFMSMGVEQRKEAITTPRDLLTYKTFVKNFNSHYSKHLSESQTVLLNKYIMSMTDTGSEFKLYLNEEIGRLKTILENTSKAIEDKAMLDKTNKVLSVIDDFKNSEIDKSMITKILKIQKLTSEINN